jgi:hypothetical protein
MPALRPCTAMFTARSGRPLLTVHPLLMGTSAGSLQGCSSWAGAVLHGHLPPSFLA